MRRSTVWLLLCLLCAACGTQAASPAHTGTRTATGARAASPVVAAVPHAHPQAIEPAAGAAASAVAPPAPAVAGPPAAGATGAGGTSGASGGQLAQPLTDAQIRQELTASGLTASANQATLAPDGLAVAPIDAPAAVQQVISAGNQIAHLPYVWGGGHVTYADTGYDCSGSISFAFGAAHLLQGSLASGALMTWGDPGPGKWITVFANQGHTFMYVAGLRFDTVALAETGSRWSARAANEPDLRTFSVRHPPGL